MIFRQIGTRCAPQFDVFSLRISNKTLQKQDCCSVLGALIQTISYWSQSMSTRNRNNFLSTANDYPIQTSSTKSLNAILFNHFPQENNILILFPLMKCFVQTFSLFLIIFYPFQTKITILCFFIISEGVEILMQLLLLVINGTIPINTITLIIKDS